MDNNCDKTKIVIAPLKVDFHIHSSFSKYKDGDLVKDGTIQNLPTLVKELKHREIDCFSITDHDYFSYDLYAAAKEFEKNNTFKKVFPGVEFSVGIFDDNKKEKQIHVICIFNDQNEEKIKNIESVLKNNITNNKINYSNGNKMFFSENKFISIIREIDLSFVTIVHQKGSITGNPRKHDLSSLGQQTRNELLRCEYFDILEFKQIKNGIFNKLFAEEFNNNYEYVKFITGSDCHQWSVYPKHDVDDNLEESEFCFSFLKCLPTFRGLSMAFSDYTRINTTGCFYSNSELFQSKIEIEINGEKLEIPLSKGINAIIGDNSIGKSLLIHKLTNYIYLNDQEKQRGYERYIKEKNINVINRIDPAIIYSFDGQGHIREMFNNGNQDHSSFLNSKFPANPEAQNIKSQLLNILNPFYCAIQNKFNYDNKKKSLFSITIPDVEVEKKVLICERITGLNQKSFEQYKKIVSYLEGVRTKIESKNANNYSFEKDDEKILDDFVVKITTLISKYNDKYKENEKAYTIQNAINVGIGKYNDVVKNQKTDSEKLISDFVDKSQELSSMIAEAIQLKNKISNYSFNIEKIEVPPNRLPYSDYVFIKKYADCSVIDNDFVNSIISSCLKKGQLINTETITEDMLADSIKEYDENSNSKSLDVLKRKVNEVVDKKLEVTSVITKNGEDVNAKLSSGMNSTIYFNIISNDSKEGIYFIDQPEDDVSQPRIKDTVLNDLKRMASKRQIILITHNPQFVINLDVDNIIFIGKDDSDNISISSGAIEYCDENNDMLRITADNLEGGVESIKKRWKRYDKRT